MTATRELIHQLADPNLSRNQRAQLRCQLAIQLNAEGDYEAAREAMGELWQRIGERPLLEGLDEETKGAVLLRVGVLTGWLGSAKLISGAQETAKNLITESIAIFEELQETSRVAEAQIDLACCYWREGAFDEGRVMLREALSRLGDRDIELRALASLRSAIIERTANRHNDALRIHAEAARLFQHIDNHLLRGSFHSEFATVLKNLGAAENREDYIDRALIEYAAASYHFEQAGHIRYQACVENNLAMLFWKAHKFAKAHEHLDRAQTLFTRLKDDVHLAQVDETRARVLLGEGRIVDAEKISRRAVRTLEKGDEQSLLAEALITHGVALSRLHHPEKARAAFSQAADVAEQAGDIESAGLAALTFLEELGQDFSNTDERTTIERANVLLEKTRDMALVKRLAVASLRTLRSILGPPDWHNFSLRDAVRTYEAHWIKLALKETGGLVTRATPLLGFKHHQSLISVINARHQDLLDTRSPVVKRKQSLLVHPKRETDTADSHLQPTLPVSILHVEDNQVVANMVKETLEAEGWNIETCVDGTIALERIESDAHYDLLLLDSDLPGVNGLDLLQTARSMAHRRLTPIVLLSAQTIEREALDAGANAVLHKPEGVRVLAKTIARYLEGQCSEDKKVSEESSGRPKLD